LQRGPGAIAPVARPLIRPWSEGHISYYTAVRGPDSLRNVSLSGYVTFYQIKEFLEYIQYDFLIIDKIASRAVVWRPCPKSCCAQVFDTVLAVSSEIIKTMAEMKRIPDLLKSRAVLLTLISDNQGRSAKKRSVGTHSKKLAVFNSTSN